MVSQRVNLHVKHPGEWCINEDCPIPSEEEEAEGDIVDNMIEEEDVVET